MLRAKPLWQVWYNELRNLGTLVHNSREEGWDSQLSQLTNSSSLIGFFNKIETEFPEFPQTLYGTYRLCSPGNSKYK